MRPFIPAMVLIIAWHLIAARAAAQAALPASRPASYAAAARTVTESIQKTFYNQQTGLYARSGDNREPDFIWGSGVMFSALAGAARHQPAVHRPLMDKFFVSLDRYWDTKVKIPGYEPAPTRGGGRDKYYDDNAWMGLTFLEAYELTRDARYLNRAEQTLRFFLSGWDVATLSEDQRQVLLILANESWKQSLPCRIELRGFTGGRAQGVALTHDDPDASSFVERKEDLVRQLPLRLDGDRLELTLPAHAVVFLAIGPGQSQ